MPEISREEHEQNKQIVFEALQNHPKRIGFGLLKEGREAATGWNMDRTHWQFMARKAQYNPEQFHQLVAEARSQGIRLRQERNTERNRRPQ